MSSSGRRAIENNFKAQYKDHERISGLMLEVNLTVYTLRLIGMLTKVG